MAYYGLRYPMIASYNRNTGAYSNGFVCGKAVSVEVNPEYSEGSLYGDNEQVEYEKVFKNASVTLGTTTLPIEAASVVFGHTVNDNSTIIKKTTDESHYVGLGIVVDEVINGTKQYCAMIVTCVQFAESGESFTTKGDSITFATPSISGLAIGDKTSQWVIKKIFESSDEALAYIKQFLNIPTNVLVSPEVSAVPQNSTLFHTSVSDIQGDDIAISNNAITGTLKYLDAGDIADYWGAGNFIALQFTDIDPNATSVKVGLDPSQSSGLVEIIDDPDRNGVFKITDKDAQVFKVVSSDGTNETVDTYSLAGLTLES